MASVELMQCFQGRHRRHRPRVRNLPRRQQRRHATLARRTWSHALLRRTLLGYHLHLSCRYAAASPRHILYLFKNLIQFLCCLDFAVSESNWRS